MVSNVFDASCAVQKAVVYEKSEISDEMHKLLKGYKTQQIHMTYKTYQMHGIHKTYQMLRKYQTSSNVSDT